MLHVVTSGYQLFQVFRKCYKIQPEWLPVTGCYKLLQDPSKVVFHSFSQTIKGCHRYWKDQHLVEKQTIATGFQGKGAVGALVELVAGVRVWIHLDKPWSQSFNLKVSLPEAPQALGTQLQWQVLQWVQAGRQEEVEAELAPVQELPAGQQQLLDELGRSLYLDLCWRWSELKMDDLIVFLTWTAAARGQLAHFQKQLVAVSKPSRHPNQNCPRFAKKWKIFLDSYLATPTTSKVSAILKQCKWSVREIFREINNFFWSSPLK